MPRSTRKRILVGIAAPILVVLFLYGFRTNILTGIFDFLIIHDELAKSDLIFVLNGDTTVRPAQAAKLFKEGWAPKVSIARVEDSLAVQLGAYPNVTDSNLIALRNLGIPEAQLVQLRPEHGVASTFDEAQALLTYTKTNPVKRIIVVTSELHSRRARFIVQRLLKDAGIEVLMAPVADRKYGATNWWTLEDGLIGCQNEYIKLIFYRLKYR